MKKSKSKLSFIDVGNLTRGLFTPLKYSEPRFESKVKL